MNILVLTNTCMCSIFLWLFHHSLHASTFFIEHNYNLETYWSFNEDILDESKGKSTNGITISEGRKEGRNSGDN